MRHTARLTHIEKTKPACRVEVLPPDERYFQGGDFAEYTLQQWKDDWADKLRRLADARERGELEIIVLPPPSAEWNLTPEEIFNVTGGAL